MKIFYLRFYDPSSNYNSMSCQKGKFNNLATSNFNAMDHQPEITNKAMPFPILLQLNLFNTGRIAVAATQFPP